MVTKGNVLVVDDEVNLCRILGAKLSRNGYSVVAVHDGQQAIDKVRESDFDIILLDLNLPKVDGLTALSEIRNMRSTLPVIIMTACESAEMLEQAKNYGVSAYLNKPFDLDNLVSIVSNTSLSSLSNDNKNAHESSVLFVKNKPITIEYQNGHGPKSLSTLIYDKDDRTLSIVAPKAGGNSVDIAPRSTVKVGIASDDAYYSFNTQVIKSVKSFERIIILDKPGVIYRIQRREHKRTPLVLPVHYAVKSENEDDVLKIGQTRNLSVGGASILVKDNILPGDVLEIDLHNKVENKSISAVSQVLRSRPNNDEKEGGNIIGCKFTKIDDALQKLLQE